ncbi:MAG: hypothetical protein BGO82_03955 [Devosia sp. 67-54]|uniref:AprI/Inh family metalloprotease inhibitor n=1 Tax=unclassified Devosia TaxID=196773 RepID=UPI000966B0C1|nr:MULTISPECIES: AprI/Inh family metalloprotease inhibitor [unclassified Devosia]MBN9305630.1 AprI/Inh family metalloprotease inhibitor [Devosia sp.]OJX19197.1 MAG: hypothetical protein BGO82_03955 [Devosia sp. 67-54]
MAGFAWRGALAAIALLALAAGPAAAADSSSSAASDEQSTVPEELQSMVGDFVLAQEDETLPTCPIRFTDQQAIGGWAVEMPAPCPAPYPSADQIAAWNVDESDGSVLLMDATRKVVMRLFEDEDGLFDTDPNVEPRFYLLAPYDEDGSGGEADSD